MLREQDSDEFTLKGEKRDDEIILIPMTRKQVEVVKKQFIEEAIEEWDDSYMAKIFDSNKEDKIGWLKKLSKTLDDCLVGDEGLKQEEIKEIAGDMYELASHLKETGAPIASEEVLSRRKKLKRWIK